MDTFFQKLRDIQKKERIDGPLSEIDDTFYDDASNYLQQLLKIVDKNPLSLEAYQLRDARRIIIEICERREVKILTTALANLQKSHDLFKGHKDDSTLFDELPYNMTYDEEQLYIDIVNTLLKHRENIIQNKQNNKRMQQKQVQTQPEVVQATPEVEVTQQEQKVVEENTEDEWVDIKPQNPVKTQKPSKDVKPQQNRIDDIDIPDDVFSSPALDESQVAMMFGEMPDSMPRDENNNPVRIKKEPKTDITTPFTPPEIPEDDTVSLQVSEDEKKPKTLTSQNSIQKHENIESDVKVDEPTTTTTSDIIDKPIPTPDETSNIKIEDDTKLDEELFNDEKLVSFNCEVNSDILDVDDRTYGPFNVDDVALLPGNIVQILLSHDIIRVL
ncbi:DNA replication complex GINS family protein [Methanosphaera cuniculi]|uniref:GINS subunit domain-containing protein n=1 Tax=Methanosphaera cuniculi TaxID=1077256 RepID=A0A2A2HFR1_9EURY|nr:hypothetical protein [Methanosphaera cuniculi]PAV08282.1 hypothetical protein ASJ82_03595 [Methanosphaera cuniculi]PWL08374.1 hypothetical protein MSCUN_08130 [Methanosphaera cuniculi]